MKSPAKHRKQDMRARQLTTSGRITDYGPLVVSCLALISCFLCLAGDFMPLASNYRRVSKMEQSSGSGFPMFTRVPWGF